MIESEKEFWPRLLSQADLLELVHAVEHVSSRDVLSLCGALRQLSDKASRRSLIERLDGLRLAVAASLLADLVEDGWTVKAKGHTIGLTPPSSKIRKGEDVNAAKARFREGLLRGSNRQIATQAVQDFLRSMQKDRVVNGKIVSIQSLQDDGPELADRLEKILLLEVEERSSAFRSLIQPTIQICESETICEHTGLFLQDIWRYFRHTWSLEYNPLPGRTLRLIVRNKARPNWPVMGIAMLASPAANLYSRDEWIGWRLDDITNGLVAGTLEPKFVAQSLLQTINDAIEELRTDDLLAQSELENPSEAAFFKLKQILAQSEAARRHDLKRRDRSLATQASATSKTIRGPQALLGQLAVDMAENSILVSETTQELDDFTPYDDEPLDDDVGSIVDIRSMPRGALSDDDWKALSETPLYRKKRAEQLTPLLRARLILLEAGFDTAPSAAILEALVTKSGRMAVSYALKELRKRGLATQVADVSVCGAVAPYNHLLAGKLVALMTASQEVREMYAKRYSSQPSEIASQLAGRALTKSADLKVLTTTSLYGVGSSQYNRLRINSGAVSKLSADLVWKELAPSEGITITHLSKKTLELMRRLGKAFYGTQRINSVFGEGSSPKTRQVREGLNLIGINNDSVLMQSIGRRVYGCELFKGARGLLTGFQRSRAAHRAPAVAVISRAWAERWAIKRIARPECLEALRASSSDLIRREFEERRVRAQMEDRSIVGGGLQEEGLVESFAFMQKKTNAVR